MLSKGKTQTALLSYIDGKQQQNTVTVKNHTVLKVCSIVVKTKLQHAASHQFQAWGLVATEAWLHKAFGSRAAVHQARESKRC